MHDHSTKNYGPHWFIFFICTRPFDQIKRSSFIYFILSLGTTIRPKIRVFTDIFLSFANDHSTKIYDLLSFIIHSLCTTIRPKKRVPINLLFLFVHDHLTKLGVTLTLLFILFFDVPIFRLLYSWQILPLHFIRYVHSNTTYIFRSVHYINWRTVLIFRTLYPWLYELLAEIW